MNESADEEYESDPNKLWAPGEREFYYNLPTNDPVTGYVDRCSMFIDLSYRRLRHFSLGRYIKSRDLPTVTHLHLQYNKLKELPDDLFSQLENLMYLDARNNDLESFPKAVKEHEGLETILLQDNLIEEFPIELGSLGGLKTLGIEFNPLQFPSHATVRQWRNKDDVIDFFRRCWKEQSRDVPAVIKKTSRKIIKPKKPKFAHVKHHTEIVCDLQKSSNVRKQREARRIQSQLAARDKILQKSKDHAVLKNWRDQYRVFKDQDRFVVLHPPPYGTDDRYNKITPKSEATKIDAAKTKSFKYRINWDAEISGIKERLGTIGSETKFRDPESEMAARLKEIKAIRQLQSRIEQLKYRS